MCRLPLVQGGRWVQPLQQVVEAGKDQPDQQMDGDRALDPADGDALRGKGLAQDGPDQDAERQGGGAGGQQAWRLA